MKPDHFWALNDLGAVHIRDGQYAKAEEVLRKCVAIEPSAIVLYNLGLSLFYGGKMNEARESFEKVLGSSGGAVPEGEVYYYLVQTYVQQGEMDRARSLYREKGSRIPEDLRAEIARALEG
jgi:predicted Zn-dependent protease